MLMSLALFNNINAAGVDIQADNSISGTAKDINIQNVNNTDTHYSKHKKVEVSLVKLTPVRLMLPCGGWLVGLLSDWLAGLLLAWLAGLLLGWLAGASSLAAKTTALAAQLATAATSSGTYGFNAGIEFDIDALERF
jgi:hypothetical protein